MFCKVEESLPEHKQDVLFIISDAYFKGYYDHEQQTWFSGTLRHAGVTHWHSLPALPEEVILQLENERKALEDKSWIKSRKYRDKEFIQTDVMPLTKHPIDKKYYDSPSKFRAVTRAHGCVEVGNESVEVKPTSNKASDERFAERLAAYERGEGRDHVNDQANRFRKLNEQRRLNGSRRRS